MTVALQAAHTDRRLHHILRGARSRPDAAPAYPSSHAPCPAAAASWTKQTEIDLLVDFEPPTVDLSLPDVLLLGDSISIGYTLPTRRRLAGLANVYRPPVNCRAANSRGVRRGPGGPTGPLGTPSRTPSILSI
jgi:hypothetical protein